MWTESFPHNIGADIFIVVAKNSITPTDSKHVLFLWPSKATDRSLVRHLSCFSGNPFASVRSFTISVLPIGDFGVGMRSTPSEALRVHQDWISLRRVWFGVRPWSNRHCLASSIAAVVKLHLSTSGTIALIDNTIYFLPSKKKKFEGSENLPPPDTPAVYVSNHQSFLDIYTLLTLGRSFKFISKTGIFLFPIIGWAMFLLGIIPLKRMDSRSQLDCLKRCMDLIKKGASVFFFPEGTRSKDGRIGTFKVSLCTKFCNHYHLYI
ncbi:1-acyl-sn-glycerol-3-phosphate acyltransferase 1, chloroplastic [Glycine max]|nr:1-acyl-sn-glycerol-3-phosphate acyltransferase 1, chloroplastic [Glycine max]